MLAHFAQGAQGAQGAQTQAAAPVLPRPIWPGGERGVRTILDIVEKKKGVSSMNAFQLGLKLKSKQ